MKAGNYNTMLQSYLSPLTSSQSISSACNIDFHSNRSKLVSLMLREHASDMDVRKSLEFRTLSSKRVTWGVLFSPLRTQRTPAVPPGELLQVSAAPISTAHHQ
jgi:hypothetical protein